MFYPESLTTTAAGRLFVGGFGTWEVVTFAPGSTTPAELVPAGSDVKRALGLLADETAGSLWLCADDTAMQHPPPPFVRRYDLTAGAVQATYSFPAPAFCNDLALDAQHNLYITDSLGTLYRLAAGADHLEPWSSDPLLASSSPGGFGANGIAWDGGTNLYVTSFNDNRLLRLAIRDDGTAAPATEITVAPALMAPTRCAHSAQARCSSSKEAEAG
jgi:streptogramin lyase